MGPRTLRGDARACSPNRPRPQASEVNRAPGLLLPCKHPVLPSCPPGLADLSPWGGGGPVSSSRSPSSPVLQP